MRFRQTVSSIIPLAVVAAGIYIALNWESLNPGESDVERAAKSACVDATRSRYDLASARAYEIRENANGFTVLVTVVQKNGDPAQVICLTNSLGGVREVSIDVR